jgi:hypothetical protein
MVVSMSGYKRNQVEEAIALVLDPNASQGSHGLQTRVKRLLEADRAAQDSVGDKAGDFAFFSAEPPGRGVEIWFSSYEAFALLCGLQLMAHGWPQGHAVSVMRGVRPFLEKEHRRILRYDPKWLFDQKEILKSAKPGDHAFDNRDPVLLTIVSSATSPSAQDEGSLSWKVCRGPTEAYAFFQKASRGLGALTMFELTTSAHRLAEELAKTEPRSRGRGH